MSHARPLPEAAVSPFPVQPPAQGEAATPEAAPPAAPDKPASGMSRAQMVGAGVAVGSAAIAAALLFWGRSGKTG